MRIEFWGDEVDSIRSFDTQSQRSIENLEGLHIYPACEVVADRKRIGSSHGEASEGRRKNRGSLRKEGKITEAARVSQLVEEACENLEEFSGITGLEAYVGYLYDKTVTFPDYFRDRKTLFVLDEPNRILQEGEAVEQEFRESMASRLEKGYLLPGQMDLISSTAQTAALLQKNHCLGFCTLESARAPWRTKGPVRSGRPGGKSL